MLFFKSREEGAKAPTQLHVSESLVSHSSSSHSLATSDGTAPGPKPPCAATLKHATGPIDTNAAAAMSAAEKEQQPAELIPPPPTFFQKYFTRPVTPSQDPESNGSEARKFSFTSIGPLAMILILIPLLFGVVAAALALTLDRSHGHRYGRPAAGGGPTDVGGPLSPVKMAIPSNFPDPSLWYENGTWYAFATTNDAGVLNPPNHASDAANNTPDYGKANVQLATSTDFVNWTLVSSNLDRQPLPFTGNWTGSKDDDDSKLTYPKISNTWAPAMIKNNVGKYVLYYSSTRGGANPYGNQHPTPHCIGVALGDNPWGPFEAQNTSVACPVDQGGAIDPEAIQDVDGSLYLVYKIDGNNIGSGGECGNTFSPIQPTPIMLQKMSADGLTPDGEATQIMTNIKSDGPLVEAPMLVRSKEGIYFLFFSSGCTRLPSYTTKYATATNITGPYTRSNYTLLETGDWGLTAPGSVGIEQGPDGNFQMAFHARVQYENVGGVRAMFTAELDFTGHTVEFVGVTNGTGTIANNTATNSTTVQSRQLKLW